MRDYWYLRIDSREAGILKNNNRNIEIVMSSLKEDVDEQIICASY